MSFPLAHRPREKACQRGGCPRVFVDTSLRGNRKYCSPACGQQARDAMRTRRLKGRGAR